MYPIKIDSILSELYPNSPYFLKCSETSGQMKSYVKKPLLSREGANVSIFKNGILTEETGGEYGGEGFVYQEYFEIPKFNGKTPVLGSWLIGGVSAGIGIRESHNLITNDMSYFAPHFIDNSF